MNNTLKHLNTLSSLLASSNHLAYMAVNKVILKYSQEIREERFVDGDSSWESVAKRVYSGSQIIYNGETYSSDWECLNWSTGGIGPGLESYNNNKPVVPIYKSFKYPTLQSIVDENPGSISDSCTTSYEYNGYLDSLIDTDSEGACPQHNHSREPTADNRDRVNRALLRQDLDCVLGKLGMSNHTELFLRLIQRESALSGQSARSGAGAIGLIQTVDAHTEIERLTGKSGVLDVEGNSYHNLVTGVLYFKRLLQIFNDDVVKAVAAYNAGPTRIKDSIRNSEARSIMNYNEIFTRPRVVDGVALINEETYNYVRALVPDELGLN